jgi:DNA-binding Lrp family transcriptional regulator
MYLDNLDELDQKIIQLLIENARISYSDIGEKTGISRVAVKARIQALEKKGVIEEYTTIINPQKVSGAVGLRVVPDPQSNAFTSDIIGSDVILWELAVVTAVFVLPSADVV